MENSKPDRTEMWKALKWVMILLVTIIIGFGAFKAWQMATAPARVVGDAAGNVKSNAVAVLNRLNVPIRKQRAFDKSADRTFTYLNEMPETKAVGVKDRGFRMANLRGSENRVCKLSYDFGVGTVPVYLAADNAGHQAAKTVGSKADRLIRIVIVTPEETLGLNAEYDEAKSQWRLGWRTSSINKPYPDEWAEKPISDILKRAPRDCSVPKAQPL